MYRGINARTVPVPLGSYLLLRVDVEHPYFGDAEPGWVLIRPQVDWFQSPDVFDRINDSEVGPRVVDPPNPRVLVGP
jgi:hypothetical protein